MKITIWEALLMVAMVAVLGVAACSDSYQHGWQKGFDDSFGPNPRKSLFFAKDDSKGMKILELDENKDGSVNCYIKRVPVDTALRETK